MRTPRTPMFRSQLLSGYPVVQDPTHQGYYPTPAVTRSQAFQVERQTTAQTSFTSQFPLVCHSRRCRSHHYSHPLDPFRPVHQRQIASPDMTEALVSSAPPPTPPNPSRLYTTIPLPPQVDPDVSVIPFLQSGSGSGLDIDLRMSSRQLGLRGEPGTKTRTQLQQYLDAAATNPPLPLMMVVHPKLLWSITVYCSEMGMGYVTVRDVLVTIVESLRVPLEVGVVDSDDMTLRRGRGGTRLDYLPGRRLLGLRKSELDEDVWIMDVV